MDYLELGPTPYDETCAQITDHDFDKQNRIECDAYKRQLRRLFPGGQFRARHFATGYREVVAYFTEADDEFRRSAFEAEATGPARWDEQAIAELRDAGYRHLPDPSPAPVVAPDATRTTDPAPPPLPLVPRLSGADLIAAVNRKAADCRVITGCWASARDLKIYAIEFATGCTEQEAVAAANAIDYFAQ